MERRFFEKRQTGRSFRKKGVLDRRPWQMCIRDRIVGGIDPAGIVMVVLLYAIPIALGLFALYWIVRKAVCAGIRDARRDGTE